MGMNILYMFMFLFELNSCSVMYEWVFFSKRGGGGRGNNYEIKLPVVEYIIVFIWSKWTIIENL